MKRRGCLIFFLAFIFNYNSFAQPRWGGGVDNEILHFGFKFQYVAAEYKILKTENWRDEFVVPSGDIKLPGGLKGLSSPVSQGFAIGFVSDYRLTNNTNIRFTPGLVFSGIIADYQPKDSPYSVQDTVPANFVDLPIGIKLKSNRLNNYRAYIIAGAKYSMEITSKNKRDDSGETGYQKSLKSIPNFLWYEAGVGLDIYLEWFKLSPEIKFSQTFKSVLLDKDRLENPYTAPIDKMFLRNLQFSLFFE